MWQVRERLLVIFPFVDHKSHIKHVIYDMVFFVIYAYNVHPEISVLCEQCICSGLSLHYTLHLLIRSKVHKVAALTILRIC